MKHLNGGYYNIELNTTLVLSSENLAITDSEDVLKIKSVCDSNSLKLVTIKFKDDENITRLLPCSVAKLHDDSVVIKYVDNSWWIQIIYIHGDIKYSYLEI